MPPANSIEDCYCAPGTVFDVTAKACVSCSAGFVRRYTSHEFISADLKQMNSDDGLFAVNFMTPTNADADRCRAVRSCPVAWNSLVPSSRSRTLRSLRSPLVSALVAWALAPVHGLMPVPVADCSPASSLVAPLPTSSSRLTYVHVLPLTLIQMKILIILFCGLYLQVLNRRSGSFTFQYSVEGTGTFVVLVDGVISRQFGPTGGSKRAPSAPIQVPLSTGAHTIQFNFYSNGDGNDRVTLEALSVFGTQIGDPIIQECAGGYFSSKLGATECEACLPGTYTDIAVAGGAAQCTPCEANTFTGWFGATQCERCSSDSSSPLGGTVCTSTCIYNATNGVSYDFRRLGEVRLS
jgi:hypothetical protein